MSGQRSRQKVVQLKQVIVDETSEEDVRRAWQAVKVAAGHGVSWASALFFERLFGKSLPGTTASLIDQAASDGLKNNLSIAEMEQMEKLSRKMYGDDAPSVSVAGVLPMPTPEATQEQVIQAEFQIREEQARTARACDGLTTGDPHEDVQAENQEGPGGPVEG